MSTSADFTFSPRESPSPTPVSNLVFKGPYNIQSRLTLLNHRLVGPPIDWKNVPVVPLSSLLESIGQEPGDTPEHLVAAFSKTRDKRLLFYTETLPILPPDSDGAHENFDEYLRESRKYRKLVPALDHVTKKMVLTSPASDCTCFKFKDLDLHGRTIHLGCGDLGSVSDFFLGVCDYADPRFNGVSWQQVDFDKYDNIVSDVAMPTEEGLGMDYNPMLIDRLKELVEGGKRVVYKAHLLEGFSGVHSKVRPHNAEAVFDSDKPYQEEEVARLLDDAILFNEARNDAIKDHFIPIPMERIQVLDEVRERSTLKQQIRYFRRKSVSSKPREFWGAQGIFDGNLYDLLIEEGCIYPVDIIPMSLYSFRHDPQLREMIKNFSAHWDTYSAVGAYVALRSIAQFENQM